MHVTGSTQAIVRSLFVAPYPGTGDDVLLDDGDERGGVTTCHQLREKFAGGKW